MRGVNPMRHIEVVEVGPRDGLQNEKTVLRPQIRAELCERLVSAGVRRIEAASFVNEDLVPQMAGAEEVFSSLVREPGVLYCGLVLNERGYERALGAGVDEVRYALPVTESFARHNQNTTVEEALDLALHLVERARLDGVRVSVTLSVAFGCPFEGTVPQERVVELAREVAAAGPDELVLADTIGVAAPAQVRALLGEVLGLGPVVGCHFHNTRNTGYANALAAVEAGVSVLDSSIGGVGGCPFAPGATGNIATEDLAYLLQRMGYETGLDLERLISCAGWLSVHLGRELPGQLYRAGAFARAAG